MYYTPQRKNAGTYGGSIYRGETIRSGYTLQTCSLPVMKKDLGNSRCCGRGCKPCVMELGL